MTDYKFHETCKNILLRVYPDCKNLDIDGWKYVRTITNENGYYAEVYKKGGKVILANRGSNTDSIAEERNKDVDSVWSIALDQIPKQRVSAECAYLGILAEGYSPSDIIVIGYSLGGSLAQILGTEYGSETITFAPIGINGIKDIVINHTKNITNYGISSDYIYTARMNNQIGKIIILNPVKQREAFDRFIKNPKAPHQLRNFPDLSKGIIYRKKDYEEGNEPYLNFGYEVKKRLEDKVNEKIKQPINSVKQKAENFLDNNIKQPLNSVKSLVKGVSDEEFRGLLELMIDGATNHTYTRFKGFSKDLEEYANSLLKSSREESRDSLKKVVNEIFNINTTPTYDSAVPIGQDYPVDNTQIAIDTINDKLQDLPDVNQQYIWDILSDTNEEAVPKQNNLLSILLYATKEILLNKIFSEENRVMHDSEYKLKYLKEDPELSNSYEKSKLEGPTQSKAQLDERVRRGELIYVDDYVRSDGTHVSGYYRTCPYDYD